MSSLNQKKSFKKG